MTKKQKIAGAVAVVVGSSALFFGNNCSNFGSSPNNSNNSLNGLPSGIPAALSLFAPMTNIPVQACNGPVTVGLLNAQGSSSVSSQNTLVQLSQGNSTSISFFTDSLCQNSANNQVTIPAGSVMGAFYLKNTTAGVFQVSASAAGLATANINFTFGPPQNNTPIQHIIVIMQENRSFDHYFGTYPGADGLPVNGQGQFTSCLPQIPNQPPLPCVMPWHDRLDYNDGAGHSNNDALADIDGQPPNGFKYKMDGFVIQQELDASKSKKCQQNPTLPECTPSSASHDVMGYHTADEIPNYWSYANKYILMDHLFEPALSWSLISHLYLVSSWAALCSNPLDPLSCITTLDDQGNPAINGMLSSAPANVTLTWQQAGVGGTYNIKRSIAPGKETLLTNVSGGTYVDYQIANGVNYYYTVSYVNSSGQESLNSNEVSVQPLGLPYSANGNIPDPVSINASTTAINLNFGSMGASTYLINRATQAKGPFIQIGTVPEQKGAQTYSYTDTTVGAGSIFYYNVVGTSTGTTSPASLQTGASLATAMSNAPTGLTANSTVMQSANAWTDMSYLLDMNGVSWKYYLATGTEPDCDDDEMDCPPVAQSANVPSYWNPMGKFTTVQQKNAANPTYLSNHVTPTDQFLVDIKNGTLPAVAWLIPSYETSEHPTAGVQEGMQYVTGLVNAIMQTGQAGYKGVNYWQNTVIIIAWDDWGGFYDHVPPPIADIVTGGTSGAIGYGIRVPGLIISPFAIPGIDHQVMSFDRFNKLIEDVFLNHQRLDPETDGRPDSRPTVRDAQQYVTDPISGGSIAVGDLLNDLNFKQTPLTPLILPQNIPVQFYNNTSNKAKAGTPIVLQWLPLQTTQSPVAYNLYRSVTSGTNYQIVLPCSSAQARGGGSLSMCKPDNNLEPGMAICCSDANVVSGGSYYYVVTSVSSGTESNPSTEVDATAP